MILHRAIDRFLRAFTLIEVLLAMAMVAVVLSAMSAVFYSALHLRDKVSSTLDDSLPLHQATAILRRDLLNAVPPGGVLAGDFRTGTAGNGFVAPPNSSLEFYTSTGVIDDNTPWGDIQKVTYQLRNPVDRTGTTGKDLIRSVSRQLLSTLAEEPNDRRLMGNVENLEFSCHDGIDWRNSWDTSLGNSSLPTAVRVRIQLATPNALNPRDQQPPEIIVPLDSQSRTNQTNEVSQ